MKPRPKKKIPKKDFRSMAVFTVIGIIVIGLVVYKFVVFFQNRSSNSQIVVVPDAEETQDPVIQAVLKLNLSAVEPQVAEKIRSLTQKVRQNPSSAEAWGKLSMTLHVHDLIQDSIPCCKRANALDGNDFRWPYYCGIAMERAGSSEAREWFERSLKLRNDYLPLHLRLGQSLLDAGKIEEATSHFQTALRLEPQSAHAYFGMAQIALRRGDLQKAKKDLTTAVRFNPRHAEAHGLLADVYRRLHESENANHELLIKQQLPPKTAIQDEMLGNLTVEGVSSYWHMMRARAYMQQKQYQEAAKELEVAIQTGPDPRYFDLLGIAYQQMGRHNEAIPLHEKALQKLPNNVDFMYNLANAYFAAGKTQQGFAVMDQIKQLKPKSAESYIDYAKFMIRTGNTARALEILREGHRQVPDDIGIVVRLAWLLATANGESLRNGREAVRLAESARARIGNKHTGTLQVLAAAYAETGQFQKALEIGQRAYQLASGTDPALAAEIQKQLRLYEAGKPYRQ